MGYELNVDRDLLKKLEATRRSENLSFCYTDGGIVITADAATFELIKLASLEYYSQYPENQGIAKISKTTDKTKKNIVQYTISVQNRQEKVYTANIYTTTSRMLVNGKNTGKFIDTDMKEVQKIINRELQKNRKPQFKKVE